MKFLIGIITALLFCLVIIWSVEHNYSFYEIMFGFIAFVFPVIFFSSIKSNASIFIFLTFSILVLYLSYRWSFYHVFIGLVLAVILGWPIHFFKVRKIK